MKTQYLIGDNLVSAMNNTKWKELVSVITSIPNYIPLVNIKYLFDKENNGSFSSVWWEDVEQNGFKHIEWMEIDSLNYEYVGSLVNKKTKDFLNLITLGFEKHSIPYDVENGIIRINGYLKPNIV